MAQREASVKYEINMTGMSAEVVSALAAEAVRQHDYISVHRDGDVEITPGVKPDIFRTLADMARYLGIATDKTPADILDEAKAQLG
jgi:hypothetical protein